MQQAIKLSQAFPDSCQSIHKREDASSHPPPFTKNRNAYTGPVSIALLKGRNTLTDPVPPPVSSSHPARPPHQPSIYASTKTFSPTRDLRPLGGKDGEKRPRTSQFQKA